jgi:hypothetical protein
VASEPETSCRQCHRKLLDWAVIDRSGKFVKFPTCPVYCDERCHMCGGKLRVKNSKPFTRTVNCKSCKWNDATIAKPLSPRSKSKKSSSNSDGKMTPPPTKKDSGYRRLTVEEMRRRNIPRVISSHGNSCSSCGVSISTNGMCRCS